MAKRKAKVKKGSDILDPRLAKALANGLRVEILAVLRHRQISPVGYVREYGGKLPTVAYHFKVLESYGCIELAEIVKRRGALEHVYRCAKRPLLGDGKWNLLPLAPVALDRKGWREMTSLFASVQARIEKIEAEAGGRMSKSGEAPIPVTVALAGFESPPEAAAGAS